MQFIVSSFLFMSAFAVLSDGVVPGLSEMNFDSFNPSQAPSGSDLSLSGLSKGDWNELFGKNSGGKKRKAEETLQNSRNKQQLELKEASTAESPGRAFPTSKDRIVTTELAKPDKVRLNGRLLTTEGPDLPSPFASLHAQAALENSHHIPVGDLHHVPQAIEQGHSILSLSSLPSLPPLDSADMAFLAVGESVGENSLKGITKIGRALIH